jgi:hypothetical protein
VPSYRILEFLDSGQIEEREKGADDNFMLKTILTLRSFKRAVTCHMKARTLIIVRKAYFYWSWAWLRPKFMTPWSRRPIYSHVCYLLFAVLGPSRTPAIRAH